jgi:hypothetical protein
MEQDEKQFIFNKLKLTVDRINARAPFHLFAQYV